MILSVGILTSGDSYLTPVELFICHDLIIDPIWCDSQVMARAHIHISNE